MSCRTNRGEFGQSVLPVLWLPKPTAGKNTILNPILSFLELGTGNTYEVPLCEAGFYYWYRYRDWDGLVCSKWGRWILVPECYGSGSLSLGLYWKHWIQNPGVLPSNRVTSSGFLHKLEISQKSLPIYHTFVALKRCTYSGPRWWFGLFRPKSSSRPWKFLVFQGDEVTLPSSNSVTLPTLQKGDGVTRIFRFSKPNFVRKTMCEAIEKITLSSVYFYSIFESKNIWRGPCFP